MATGIHRTEPKWLDIQRRVKVRKDADGNVIARRESAHWYGRMKVNGRWRWVKLFTDKRASQGRWEDIIRQHEQKQAGVITSQMDAATRPLSEHVTEYLDGLKRTVTDAHYKIAKGMLGRFIRQAGWKSLADINEQSASRTLTALQAKGLTVAYTNQYLARVKAFLNWCIPDRLIANPLAKVKRGNAKKALKRRARRPLAEHELAKLLNTCPPSRRLKYAIPAFTGLRRGELAEVRWGDLHLDSVIPYIQLRPEQTKTGEATAMPLHPYIVNQLRELMPGMPETKLFATLPEGRTLLRDLTKAGVKQTDAMGRRADYHGLRHTFAKRLDESGCSHATRRALMRHGAGDQTDGYTLARLAEMHEAVNRLPTPNQAEAGEQVRTGTDNVPLIAGEDAGGQGGHEVDTGWTRRVLDVALAGNDSALGSSPAMLQNPRENQGDFIDRHDLALPDLPEASNRDSVMEIGPRSSVG